MTDRGGHLAGPGAPTPDPAEAVAGTVAPHSPVPGPGSPPPADPLVYRPDTPTPSAIPPDPGIQRLATPDGPIYRPETPSPASAPPGGPVYRPDSAVSPDSGTQRLASAERPVYRPDSAAPSDQGTQRLASPDGLVYRPDSAAPSDQGTQRLAPPDGRVTRPIAPMRPIGSPVPPRPVGPMTGSGPASPYDFPRTAPRPAHAWHAPPPQPWPAGPAYPGPAYPGPGPGPVPAAAPLPGRNGSGGLPANSPWWSDAPNDPWRRPGTEAVVVRTPPSDAPPLEDDAVPSASGRRSLGLVFVVALVTALLAGALGGALGYVAAHKNGTGALPSSNEPPALANRAPDSLAGIVRRVLPSVVTIQTKSGNKAGTGSGFIIAADGYVLTNAHVVGADDQAMVVFNDGTTIGAKLVGADRTSDVAVIRVDRKGLPAIAFGDSDKVAVGDPVLAVGSPLRLSNTVTFGIVSALDRTVQAGDSNGKPNALYAAIQTDAAINPGNSGGPLVNGNGEIIGINSSIATPEKGAGNIGIGFAIPINQARRLAQDIIATGKAKRTVMGATFDATFKGPTGGVRLATVEADGPAAKAGMKVGDVITRLNNRLLDDPTDLNALIRKQAPGTVISVEYSRDGAKLTAQVTLAAVDAD